MIKTKENEMNISYSKLMLFNQCPRKYYKRYIEKSDIKETTWPGGIFGSSVHEGLEDTINMLNDGATSRDVIGSLHGKFETYFEAIKVKEKKTFKESREYRSNKKKFYNEGNRALKSVAGFLTSYYSWNKIEPEKKYVTTWNKKEKINCVGIVDIKLTNDDDSLSIIDLKVTKDSSLYWHKTWNDDLQSLMYDKLVYGETKILPRDFTYLVYDRELKMLFIKQRPINLTGETDFDLLNNKIEKLISFNKNATEELAIELAISDKEQCHWCVWSKSCDKKWVDENTKKAKLIANKIKRKKRKI